MTFDEITSLISFQRLLCVYLDYFKTNGAETIVDWKLPHIAVSLPFSDSPQCVWSIPCHVLSLEPASSQNIPL
jgi:hypothetical protein